jgi:hypothetical protein
MAHGRMEDKDEDRMAEFWKAKKKRKDKRSQMRKKKC